MQDPSLSGTKDNGRIKFMWVMTMMVDINYKFNHQGNKSLGTFVRDSLDWCH